MHSTQSTEHQKLVSTFGLIKLLMPYLDGKNAAIAGGFVRDTHFSKDPSKVNDVDIFINNSSQQYLIHKDLKKYGFVMKYLPFIYDYEFSVATYTHPDYLPVQLIAVENGINIHNHVIYTFDYYFSMCMLSQEGVKILPIAQESYDNRYLNLNKQTLDFYRTGMQSYRDYKYYAIKKYNKKIMAKYGDHFNDGETLLPPTWGPSTPS